MGRFLGPLGLALTAGFAVSDFAGTEGNALRKLGGAFSGATFGAIPGPRSAEEAFAQGQTSATEALEAGRLASINNLTPQEQFEAVKRGSIGASDLDRSVDGMSKIRSLSEQIVRHKQMAQRADRWDRSELEGMLRVEEERLRVMRQNRRQRQLEKANEALEGPDGLTKAFGIRRRRTGDPAQAMRQTTEQMLGNLNKLRPKGAEALAKGYVSWAREMERRNPKLKGLAAEAAEQVEAKFKQMGRNVKVINGEIWGQTELTWDNIKKAVTSNADRARQEGQKAFTDLQQAAVAALVQSGMRHGTARKVVQGIEDGKSEAQARRAAGGNKTEGIDKVRAQAAGATGMRVPGQGLQDTMPINGIAAPGELIVNRHTENRLNRKLGMLGTSVGAEVGMEGRRHAEPIRENAMYGMRVPRYFAGGIVGLGKRLQRQGYTVGEHPAFGGVAGVHTPGSYHYKGQALDINADSMPGGEMKNLDRLYRQLKNMSGVVELLWRTAGHFDHLHVAMAGKGSGRLQGGGMGPVIDPISLQAPRIKAGGAAGALAQRNADAVAAGIENAVNRRIGAGGRGGGAGGSLDTWLTRALKITGHYSPQNLRLLRGRAMQESGGDPMAINSWDSNAAAGDPSKGLLQTIGATFNAYKMRGHGDIWNPVDNAIAAVRYMFGRYGHIVGPSDSGYTFGGRIPDWGGWFGNEGKITAHRPTLLGIGDSGTETAVVRKGGGGGATVRIGTIRIENHREGDIEKQIRREVGDAFDKLADELDESDDHDEEAALL